MGLKRIVLVFIFLFFACASLVAEEVEETSTIVSPKAKATKESPQQIGDFTLSGSGDKGKKAWDLGGKSADIYNDVV
ncbi:MAG: hypothetical protein Q7S42_01205 [Candidatus Omnitrophota bacterium]|nr:hypothetical protein [Candidatus Omnitrophota bacterium]